MNRKIYGLTTVLDEYKIRYVGTTISSGGERLDQHIRNAERYGGGTPVYDWIRSRRNNGYEIIMIKLEENVPHIQCEVIWISSISNLLNLLPGGEGALVGGRLSLLHRLKISETALRNGRDYTESAKKVSETLTGRKLSLEHVQKLKDAMRPKWTKERRLSVLLTNKDPTVRLRRSKAAKRRSSSPEQREILAERGRLGAMKRWGKTVTEA